MSPRIFVTGISGYIGGHTVKSLVEKHPEYEVVALVRNEQQAKAVKEKLPGVSTVIGDLDSHDLLKSEGTKADVVLQMASADHIAVGNSVIEGIAAGKNGGHYIHTSGSGILHDVSNGYGNPSEKKYSDVKNLTEILSFDENHVHRDVDASVIAAGEKHGVATAILSPPTIYGIGQGPLKKRSLQIPFLTDAILKRGKAFTVGAGGNIWDHIHIQDLANAYILLVEEALKGPASSAAWGREGYYFAAGGEHTWAQVTAAIAKHAHARNALPTAEVDQLSVEEAMTIHPWAPLLWGGNCRGVCDRIHGLGWKAVGPTILESIPEMVDFELEAAGEKVSATTFDGKT